MVSVEKISVHNRCEFLHRIGRQFCQQRSSSFLLSQISVIQNKVVHFFLVECQSFVRCCERLLCDPCSVTVCLREPTRNIRTVVRISARF
uniref:Uncharacterized protein n=1 Tax=uncultured marine virus TaxID=186617 RepID=A0A0F7L3W7_9VIRU|nr:hypothetical protein [uncultured marine virus]